MAFKKPPKPTTADDFINASRTHTREDLTDDLTRSSFQLPRALLRRAKMKAAEQSIPIAEVLRQALERFVSEGTSG